MSLDGFIATTDDDISWLSCVEKEGEDYGYVDFTSGVDAYIVGRKTYSKVMDMIGTFPQAKQFDCYIITRQNLPAKEGITFYNGDLKDLIARLKSEEGKDIYCDGGGEIVQLLMKDQLIDEYIVSVIPTILGDGKRLFLGGVSSQNITLKGAKTFETGLVQLHYVTASPSK